MGSKDKTKPFLRWAGGKQLLLKHILPFIYKDYDQNTYWEPFLGSGAFFFALRPKRAVLSDLNKHLINCFKAIKDDPYEVHEHLSKFTKTITPSNYYKIRNDFNKNGLSIINAARFIYLNRTCFNGLYRVNKNEKFNVPYGYKKNPIIPTKEDLLNACNLLQNSLIISGSYEDVLVNAEKGDFIYLDPPYPPLDKTSYFNNYTKQKFTHKDQILLSRVSKELDKKGCLLMISNADLKEIRDLYHGWDIQSLSVVRWITCKRTKHKVNEIIIRNY